jgi:hypothetical protein
VPSITVLDTESRWNRHNQDEYLWWPRVLWIDPGVVSGVAVVWFDPQALFERKKTAKVLLAYSEMFLHGPEIGMSGQITQFLRVRKNLDTEPGLATGIESFVPLSPNRDKAFLSPVRIGHTIEWRMSILKPLGADEVGSGIPVYWQSPSDALNAFTNDRLKALRMYRPGPDHVNDAKRHCLLWIRKLVDNRALFENAHGHEEGWFNHS